MPSQSLHQHWLILDAMLLVQGFAMEDAIRPAVAVLAVQGAAVVPALVQVALMQELRDAVVVLALVLDSVPDAVLAQLHAKVAATPVVEEHAEHLLVRVHVSTNAILHAMDVDHAVAHAMDVIAVLVDALLLAVEVARAAHLVVGALAATAVKAVVVTVSLLAVAHAGQLLSNFYI